MVQLRAVAKLSPFSGKLLPRTSKDFQGLQDRRHFQLPLPAQRQEERLRRQRRETRRDAERRGRSEHIEEEEPSR